MKTPTINVNLKPCDCPPKHQDPRDIQRNGPWSPHFSTCAATPVLIPCPIQRSMMFEVRLGECRHGFTMLVDGRLPPCPIKACPSHPVRVSCSISGKTWEESEVGDISPIKTDGRGVYEVGWERGQVEPLTRAVRERWALVKALVLGQQAEPAESEPVRSMLVERDALFSVLADMARAEEKVWKTQEWACRAVDSSFIPDNFMNAEPHSRPSASILERYVERLIEQVGVLP